MQKTSPNENLFNNEIRGVLKLFFLKVVTNKEGI